MLASTKRSVMFLFLTPAILLIQVALAREAAAQEAPAFPKKEKLVKKLRIEVRAEDTGLPLAHATVQVSSADGAFTDDSPTGSDGSVTFSNVPSGTVKIRVTFAKCKNFGSGYDLGPQDTVTIPIQLQKENKDGDVESGDKKKPSSE
jgi:hypothetical protein